MVANLCRAFVSAIRSHQIRCGGFYRNTRINTIQTTRSIRQFRKCAHLPMGAEAVPMLISPTNEKIDPWNGYTKAFGATGMNKVLHLLLDRIETPLGRLYLVADQEGDLRFTSWADDEAHLLSLLERKFGKDQF